MKKSSLYDNNKQNPLDQIEDPAERYAAKYHTHASMIAKLAQDPRFDIEVFLKVVDATKRKHELINALRNAISGKIGEKFPLGLVEFIVDYLFEAGCKPWWAR